MYIERIIKKINKTERQGNKICHSNLIKYKAIENFNILNSLCRLWSNTVMSFMTY